MEAPSHLMDENKELGYTRSQILGQVLAKVEGPLRDPGPEGLL